ncbi:tyrosine-type recombinase/integrase [Zavarzinella formosa]|uniref:tyrosine-type recombinase/integrase n=1 Tax=Zavarzinella formosa TaxID=360055 RepID=UPI00030FDC13|nr:site-specific integrase [Zavarzinella formosa]
MPARRKNDLVSCRYFQWIITQRDGMLYADGRGNTPSQGRHSLGARDRAEALRELAELDRRRAVDAGLAPPEILQPSALEPVPLERGRQLYVGHVSRPRSMGGAKPQSVKRYRPVFDKFLAFAARRRLASWNEVNETFLANYACWLEEEEYGIATQYLELTTLKQVIKWLSENGHLPPDHHVRLRLPKPQGTTTWCWRPAEVAAMLRHCRADPELNWLGDVLLALACTGLRISELASLRWGDVDLSKNVILLTDDSRRSRRSTGRAGRQTKSGRDRSFPINDDLRAVLDATPRSSDGLIFHGPRGGRLKPDTLRNILVRDVLTPLAPKFPHPEGEPGFRDGRLHSFRHYFCSACASGGVPERVVKTWLGHSDSDMVSRYYHLHDAESQRQMRNMRFVGGEPDQCGTDG